MDQTLKSQILSNYLAQQMNQYGQGESSNDLMNQSHQDQDHEAENDEDQGNQPTAMPTQEELDEFKNYVKAWMDIDNSVKKLQALVKERNSMKQEITSRITNFMKKYNIEELNTREGKIKFSVRKTKVPVKKTDIKNKLIEYFPQAQAAEDLANKVFESNQYTEKQSLRRCR
jgi:flagellar basal body-associated protein FliL